MVAQEQVPTHKHLAKEDSAALNALVMYPTLSAFVFLKSANTLQR